MKSFLFFALLILTPTVALADMGVPMIALAWPAAWLLLVPIVLIEAYVGFKKFGLSFKRALKIAAATNSISTLLGIPLAWIVALAFEMGFGFLCNNVFEMKQTNPNIGFQALYYVIMAPWTYPFDQSIYETAYYTGAALVLCFPFFISSYYVEYWAGKKFFKNEDPNILKRWSWWANLASYGFIILVLLGLIAGSLFLNRNNAWLPRDSTALTSPNKKYVLICTPTQNDDKYSYNLELKDIIQNQSIPVTQIRWGSYVSWSPDGDKFFLNLTTGKSKGPWETCLVYSCHSGLILTDLITELEKQDAFNKTLWKHNYDSCAVEGIKWLDSERVELAVPAGFVNRPLPKTTVSATDKFYFEYQLDKGFKYLESKTEVSDVKQESNK